MKRVMYSAALLLSLAACEKKEDVAPPKRAPAAATAPAATAAPAAAAAVAAPGEPPMVPVGTKMKCAVTGEDFTVKPTTVQIVHEGKRYAFCCEDCRPEFLKNPAKFAQK